MRKLSDTIKDQDYFAHVITMNFDKQGDTHKTIAGGAVSFILKILMGVYIFMVFRNWIMRLSNT